MSHTIDVLHQKLVSVLIAQDKAEDRRHPNIYRMGHYLKAAQEAQDEAAHAVAQGADPQSAYVEAVTGHFHPMPRLRTFLRKLDPTIDVQRQRWVIRGEVR